jgi:thiamine kinase-like enzyme
MYLSCLLIVSDRYEEEPSLYTIDSSYELLQNMKSYLKELEEKKDLYCSKFKLDSFVLCHLDIHAGNILVDKGLLR